MSDEKKPTPPSSAGGGNPAACTTAACPLKHSMTPAEAQSLMDEFKKTDVPFDYPVDCCYARARMMCDMMEKKGFASEKLWSKGNLAAKKADGTPVTFPDRNGNPQAVQWGYHVAPIVDVEQPGGGVEKRVLDPSLSDKPLTVDEWKARCGVSPSATQDKITPANENYPFRPDLAGKDFPVSAAENSLQAHRISRDRNLAAAKG
ncbi:MAG: protein-glutamine glutaminase family protein [Methylococcaceae bacterium]|nr:protein-glutamine glutaminase family protein [Methylococcaceae bacterium]